MFYSDKELFQHIFDEIKFLENETKSSTKEEFLSDPKAQRAFARSIEIIGEAVKNLSSEITLQYPEVEWRNISGMRDKLIHGYFAVSYKLVWDVSCTEIPQLRKYLEMIVPENLGIFTYIESSPSQPKSFPDGVPDVF